MNDFFKRVVAPGQSNLSTSQLLQAGVLAGLTQQCTTLPLEVVRTRMTVGAALQPPMVYNGILDCLGTIVRTEGVFGLYVWMRVCVCACGCVCGVFAGGCVWTEGVFGLYVYDACVLFVVFFCSGTKGLRQQSLVVFRLLHCR